MKKKIKAYGVTWKDANNGERFVPIGNGHEFQFPIFHNRNEAKDYVKRELRNFAGRITKVEITFTLPKGTK